MPNFVFKCQICDGAVELILPLNSNMLKLICPDCRQQAMRRIIAPNFGGFKGFKIRAGDWFKKTYGFDMAERPYSRKAFQEDLKKAERLHKKESQ